LKILRQHIKFADEAHPHIIFGEFFERPGCHYLFVVA